MQRAIDLAARGRGVTRPNPCVGAVIVDGEGQILGEGWHKKAGGPHAEVEALNAAKAGGHDVKGATMFVTLEPCNHQGRTRPCTEAIIEAGIGHLVIAMRDPNQSARGGAERLRDAGISVDVGVLRHEALLLNPDFNTFHMLNRPLVTLKWAMTLDGCTAMASGDSRWITGEAARREVHRRRATHDAVMAGIATVLRDNARLTVRLSDEEIGSLAPEGFRPVRIALDSMLRLSPFSAFVRERDSKAIIVCAEDAGEDQEQRLRNAGAEVLRIRRGSFGISIPDLIARLARMKIASLYVEGGRTVAGRMLHHGLVDRLECWIAPKIAGGGVGHLGPIQLPEPLEKMSEARSLHHYNFDKVEEDFLVEGWLTHHLFPDRGNKEVLRPVD